MREVMEQIESHTEVIDLHIPNHPIALKGTKVARATLGLVPPVTAKTPITPLAIGQNPPYRQIFSFMCILILGGGGGFFVRKKLFFAIKSVFLNFKNATLVYLDSSNSLH